MPMLSAFGVVFVNHRPAFGFNPAQLQHSFEVLSRRREDSLVLDRGHLLALLQSKGIDVALTTVL